jgi:coproporphyrinogen III oxidase
VTCFEALDGSGQFVPHDWSRPSLGGGLARILEGGRVFERGGINTSTVAGDRLPNGARSSNGTSDDLPFFATGISLVLHPVNPSAPSFHANFRYFEQRPTGDDNGEPIRWWFGGGLDLTPIYAFAEDAVHFHRTLKECCDHHNADWYPEWKANCDHYFYLPHRREMRGVGGIFFDQLTGEQRSWDAYANFISDALAGIEEAYVPILRRRMDAPYDEGDRQWQLLRRGRYVEFNLLYDRGTRFGLQTDGNVEAIFMSFPPFAGWAFGCNPVAGSREAMTLSFLQPRDWVAG